MNHRTSGPLRTLLVVLLGVAPVLASANDPTTRGSTVYLPNDSGIVLVDSGSHQRIGAIAGTDNSHGLAITPDGRTLVAGSLLARAPGTPLTRPSGVSEQDHQAHHSASSTSSPAAEGVLGTLYLVDVHQGEVTRRIEVPGAVHHTLVTPDGRHAVSTHPALSGVSIVDLATGNFTRHVETGAAPDYLVSKSDGSRIYVSNSGSGMVSELDTTNWLVNREFEIGGAPGHLALSADETTLFTVDVGTGSVAAVELSTARMTQRYPVGSEPHGVALSEDGKQLFVSSIQENRLTAIDLATGAARSRILDPAPYHITTVPGTGKIYVSSRSVPRVWVVDQVSLHVDGAIATDGITHQMVVRENPQRVDRRS